LHGDRAKSWPVLLLSVLRCRPRGTALYILFFAQWWVAIAIAAAAGPPTNIYTILYWLVAAASREYPLVLAALAAPVSPYAVLGALALIPIRGALCYTSSSGCARADATPTTLT